MNRHRLVASALAAAVVVCGLATFAQTPQPQLAPEVGFELPSGLQVKTFAAEPAVTKVTNIAVDDRGRVWVLEGRNYRNNFLNSRVTEGDRIVILEDSNGDGTADKHTTFYQGTDVNAALGIAVLGDKVFVSAYENVFLFTNKDDKPASKQVLFRAQTGNSDHSTHAFVFGPDGRLYWNAGNSVSRVMDPSGKPIVDITGKEVTNENYRQGKAFRLNEDGSQFDVIGSNFRNNFELAVDSYGSVWQSDNDDDGNASARVNYVMEYGNFGYQDEMTGAAWRQPRYDVEPETASRHWHQNSPGVVPNVLVTGAGSPAGITVYEGNLLPAPFRGQMIHAEPGWNVVRAYPVRPNGAGYAADVANLLRNPTNAWFRPSDVAVAPDGSLFVADWADPGVGGHRQGDQTLGRIYRVAPSGSRYTVPATDTTTLPGAIEGLKSPSQAVFYKAWHRLRSAGAEAEGLLGRVYGDNSPDNARFRARALWLLARIQDRSDTWIRRGLGDRDPNIRVTALRAARQNAASVLPYVAEVVDDREPAVRREAAIALRLSKDPKAADLWAELAMQHDGRDRWYLEALGIGAHDQWDQFFAAWQQRVNDGWIRTPGGRDIVWRSRTDAALPLLRQLIESPEVSSTDRPRSFRALDFYPRAKKQELLRQLIGTGQTESGSQARAGEIAALALYGLEVDINNLAAETRIALGRALESTKGTTRFVDLVERFQLRDRAEELVTMALADPDGAVGKSAARLAIALVSPVAAGGRGGRGAAGPGGPAAPGGAAAPPVAGAAAPAVTGPLGASAGARGLGAAAPPGGGFPGPGRGGAAEVDSTAVAKLFAAALTSSQPTDVKRAILLLGSADHAAARQVLRDFILEGNRPDVLRVEAVRALGTSRQGETMLLSLVTDGKLAESLRPAAASVLFASYTASTREAAAKSMPSFVPAGGPTLPSPAELALRLGDAGAGAAVFKQYCTACHRVGTDGVSFGPDLTLIGGKLAKQALLSKIIQPNSGITFGFEGYAVQLRNGETVAGYIESETPQQVSVRVVGGATQRLTATDIVGREALPSSLMPTGLASAMTERQLVDLVEYLASLKGTSAPSSR